VGLLATVQQGSRSEPAKRFVLAVVEYVYEPEATIHFDIDPANRSRQVLLRLRTGGRGRLAGDGPPGALPRQTTDAGALLDDAVGALVHAVTSAGLPEPDMPWQLNGFHLFAAWPDDRMGIASEQAASDVRLDGWEIRGARDWTAGSLIDALRGGR
jgi:hypothetical protein